MTLPDGNVNQKVEAPEASGATEPEYITKEEFAKFGDVFTTKLNEWYRGVQSENQRLQNAVKDNLAQLDDYVAMLKSQGVELKPEQINAMRSQVESKTISQQMPQAGESDGEADNETDNPVTLAGDALQKRIGAVVEDDDPEVEIILKAVNGTPDEYLEAVAEAAQAKKARLEREGKDTSGQLNTNLKGRPSANPIENITSPEELWQRAVEEGYIK